MRRKLVVAACCVLLFGAGWVFGQSRASWNRTRYVERFRYVEGYNLGYFHGNHDAQRVYKIEPSDQIELNQAQTFLSKYTFVPIESMINTMSNFYNDYRNLSVCWGDAIRFSALTFMKNPPTEQQLEAARQWGSQNGCK